MSVISVLKRHLPNAVHTKLFYLATKLNMLFATAKILRGKPLKKKLTAYLSGYTWPNTVT